MDQDNALAFHRTWRANTSRKARGYRPYPWPATSGVLVTACARERAGEAVTHWLSSHQVSGDLFICTLSAPVVHPGTWPYDDYSMLILIECERMLN